MFNAIKLCYVMLCYVFMSYDLTEHASYMFYCILYHFKSQMRMYILYIVFICIIVYMFSFIEGHLVEWLV